MLTPCIPRRKALAETYRRFEIGIAPAYPVCGYRQLVGRLIFPIRNEAGVLAGFAGRRMDDAAVYDAGQQAPTAVAKYINSSASALYRKSALLYGLHLATASISRRRHVIIVEGYKDLVALHAAGFSQSVALCGTAFTPEQLRMLSSHTRHLLFLLDGDKAGSSDRKSVV